MVGGLGANANLANTIYGNVMNPAMDMWNSLLQNETSRLTSSQASGGGGGGSGMDWLGPVLDIAGGIFGF
jgi:hypothetical protein